MLSPTELAPLSGIFYCVGDDPFSLTQSIDAIRQHYKEQGYEREVQTVDARFDWSELESAQNALSLFASKRLLEWRLDSCKLDKKAIDALKSFSQHSDQSVILLLWSNHFDASIMKTKWLSDLKSCASTHLFRPLKGPAFAKWLRTREAAYHLSLSATQQDTLVQHFEGNALAAEQCFKQLHILCPDGAVTDALFSNVLSLQSRMDVFEILDAACLQQTSKALAGLERSRASGTAGLAILAPITYQLRQLHTCHQALLSGASRSAACQTAQIWPSKQSIMLSVVDRLSASIFPTLLQTAAGCERAFKRSDMLTGWTGIVNIILALTGQTALLEAACISEF